MQLTLFDERWLPKSVLCLRDYSANKFLHDLLAGITVGLVALPLAMAFAIASGLTPQAGIYCAVVTGFIISALGGSTTQIGGPTGAFVVVIAGIVAVHGVDGLFMCTVMAGLILVVMGLTGMGTAVKYIPRPIVIGFTNGIAILIEIFYLRAGNQDCDTDCNRFHQRYRHPDCQHAGKRFLRSQTGEGSGRFLVAHGGSGAEFSHLLA